MEADSQRRTVGNPMADSKSSKIKYLLNLKFRGQEEGFGISGMDEEDQEIERQFLQGVAAYKAELEAKPESELDILIEVEQEVEEARVRQEQRHRPFFDQPAADADFATWTRIPTWTSDQATALLLGKEPSIVRWAKLKEHLPQSAFARRYGQLKAFFEASQAVQELSSTPYPNEIITWARDRGFPIPPALETAFLAVGAPVSPSRPNASLPLRTGGPGRPSSMKNLVLPEFERRLQQGLVAKTVREESRILAEWLHENHPSDPCPTPKTIENKIRDQHREWRAETQN